MEALPKDVRNLICKLGWKMCFDDVLKTLPEPTTRFAGFAINYDDREVRENKYSHIASMYQGQGHVSVWFYDHQTKQYKQCSCSNEDGITWGGDNPYVSHVCDTEEQMYRIMKRCKSGCCLDRSRLSLIKSILLDEIKMMNQ